MRKNARAELVEKLLEYKLYKAMAQELKYKHTDAERTYYKKQNIPEAVAAYTPPVDILQRLLVIQHLCVLTEYLLMFVNVRKIRLESCTKQVWKD